MSGFGQGGFGKGEFKRPRIEAGPAINYRRPAVTKKKEDPGPFFIQGYKASDLEWRTYRALKRLGWSDDRIQFQTSILGGRNPGGQVLDFVLYGPGSVYVINVNGDYWHKFGSKGDQARYSEQQITTVMPAAIVTTVWSSDLIDDEMALGVLRRLVGRGM